MGLTTNIYENQNPVGEMLRARLWPVRRMLKVADIPRQGTSFWVDDMSSIGGFHSHVPKNGWFIEFIVVYFMLIATVKQASTYLDCSEIVFAHPRNITAGR